MGLLVSPETHRIDLGDGEWVEVRKYMTLADQQALIDQVTEAETRTDGTGRIRFSVAKATRVLLELMIVAWSDPDAVTPENIGRLPPHTADRIRQEIDRLNERGPERKKGSTASSSAPSSGTARPDGPAS